MVAERLKLTGSQNGEATWIHTMTNWFKQKKNLQRFWADIGAHTALTIQWAFSSSTTYTSNRWIFQFQNSWSQCLGFRTADDFKHLFYSVSDSYTQTKNYYCWMTIANRVMRFFFKRGLWSYEVILNYCSRLGAGSEDGKKKEKKKTTQASTWEF